MANATNNYKTNNVNNCTRPSNDINKIAEKAINDISNDIKKMAEATGIKAEDIITRLMAELKVSIGDIDTTIKTGDVDVPLFSGNTFNITIGDISVAERKSKVKTKKSGKKNKKNKK